MKFDCNAFPSLHYLNVRLLLAQDPNFFHSHQFFNKHSSQALRTKPQGNRSSVLPFVCPSSKSIYLS